MLYGPFALHTRVLHNSTEAKARILEAISITIIAEPMAAFKSDSKISFFTGRSGTLSMVWQVTRSCAHALV